MTAARGTASGGPWPPVAVRRAALAGRGPGCGCGLEAHDAGDGPAVLRPARAALVALPYRDRRDAMRSG